MKEGIFTPEVAATEAAEMNVVEAPATTTSVQPEVDNTTEEQPTAPAEGGTPPEAPEAPAKGKKKGKKADDEPEISDEEWAALNYWEKATCTKKGARSRQKTLFGRHWSGSTDPNVIVNGANEFLNGITGCKEALEAMLRQKAADDAEADAMKQAANAANMSKDQLMKMVKLYQDALAATEEAEQQ